MSNREDRLRSLLDKVRAKRPDERATQAADVLHRIRTASGSVPASRPASATSPPAESPAVSSDIPTRMPSNPALEPPTSPTIESPTRYSSQPPRVERPLSVEPRARSVRPSSGSPQKPFSSVPARVSSQAPAQKAESIRTEAVVSTGQPIVYSTEQPEFARPKTFGDLLDLTLSLRPR